MSITVALDRLVEEATQMGGWAYILTVSGDGRPHAVAAGMTWSEAGELVGTVGHRSLANASARPEVSLLWPPAEPGGHSLIVDGTARVVPGTGRDGLVIVTPTRAVYHRPAPLAEGTGPACQPGPTTSSGCGALGDT